MTENFTKPEEIVIHYYKLLYGGGVGALKEFMVRSSYLMTLEAFGLRLSLKNQAFKSLLEKAKEDEDALMKAEELLSEDLASREVSPDIRIVEVEMNGKERLTVHYTEDKKKKKLYFSKENDVWKIDYYAGRKFF
ncbi:MAG: hypothetical protein QG567_1755 [Campylobacterota bacterium]|nr:hypothetical protein [Campylobacterota bacterium]MDQ1340597.1 hypothetical protein [Campylobacterota bacterium]